MLGRILRRVLDPVELVASAEGRGQETRFLLHLHAEDWRSRCTLKRERERELEGGEQRAWISHRRSPPRACLQQLGSRRARAAVSTRNDTCLCDPTEPLILFSEFGCSARSKRNSIGKSTRTSHGAGHGTHQQMVPEAGSGLDER
ncbi:hypothetical protein DNTS_003432 [Danionella cerebrum]|uniref:Uncharacterized protein n=1 Tax=Danionella cerebrum TaxID=2873325 RepID=A0A553PR87_9TELE|nr:hypothetical protein DNTS_003432 [Danionella translucida]